MPAFDSISTEIFARQLLEKGEFAALKFGVLFAGLGLISTLAPAILMGGMVQTIYILLMMLLGGVIGYIFGSFRSVTLRAQANQLLVGLEIEKNTRKPVPQI